MSTRSSFGQKRTNAGTLKDLNALMRTSQEKLNIFRGEKYFEPKLWTGMKHTQCKDKGKVHVHAAKAYGGGGEQRYGSPHS